MRQRPERLRGGMRRSFQKYLVHFGIDSAFLGATLAQATDVLTLTARLSPRIRRRFGQFSTVLGHRVEDGGQKFVAARRSTVSISESEWIDEVTEPAPAESHAAESHTADPVDVDAHLLSRFKPTSRKSLLGGPRLLHAIADRGIRRW